MYERKGAVTFSMGPKDGEMIVVTDFLQDVKVAIPPPPQWRLVEKFDGRPEVLDGVRIGRYEFSGTARWVGGEWVPIMVWKGER